MRKNIRLKKLLNILINESDYVTTTVIAKNLNVSSRTVFNDLNSGDFKSMLYGATIDRVQSQGIKLVASDSQLKKISYHLYDNDYPLPYSHYFSDIENILFYFMKSETNTVSKIDLADYLFIDTSSLDVRIKQTNLFLNNSKVTLSSITGKGITLKGHEKDIRYILSKIFIEKIDFENNNKVQHDSNRLNDSLRSSLEVVFSSKILTNVIEIVDISEINLNEVYTSYDYSLMIIKLCVQVTRIISGHLLDDSTLHNDQDREYLIASLLATRLNNTLNIRINSHEIGWLTDNIISSRRIGYNTRQRVLSEDKIATQFISLISAGLGVDLSNDTELKVNLMKHLIPAIHRMKHGIQVENPILKHVKYEYTQEYIVVMTCISEIENAVGIKFDPNELGYVCLHVIAAVNRNSEIDSVNALLICDGGLAVSSYLSSRIEHNFSVCKISQVISSYEIDDYNFSEHDLIINASYRSTKKVTLIPFVAISPLFSHKDENALSDWLINYRYNEILKSTTDISSNTFFFNDNLKTKEEVIKRYSKLLEIDNYVTDSFFKTCLEREISLPTTIGRGIALPHGDEKEVLKSAIVIIKLDNEILWDNQKVDLIFLLAIDKSDTEDFRNVIRKLNKLVTNENTLHILKYSNDRTKIRELLFDDVI